jgi:RimJ/RimL family protein N-acetyltransferase
VAAPLTNQELPQAELADERVLLRPWHVTDAAALADLCRDPDILRWTGVPDDYTPDMAVSRAEKAQQLRLGGTALLYAVCDAQDRRLLGAIDLLFRASDPAIAEVAYMLGAHARGRGVMTAAVRLLCGHAFDQLGVRRVELLHHPDNRSSAAVAARAGEARLRSYRVKKTGVAEDRLIHSLLGSDPR